MGDNQKNKLVKLLSRFRFSIMFGTVEVMRWTIPTRDILTALVDYLVAKGVTVQKWTPVTDGMPELIPCDAVEVVHGRWVEDTAYCNIACTECGHMWNIIDNCTETFNYCPNCGAKMDGGDDDV